MIHAARVNVGTAPTLLDPAVSNPESAGVLAIRNLGTVPVFIGAAEVTAGTGWEVGPAESLSIEFSAHSDIYAVAASGTQSVQILRSGV